MKKLVRSKKNQMICGVCAGIGEYFDIDPTIVRLVAAAMGLSGSGLFVYIVAAIIIPEEGEELE